MRCVILTVLLLISTLFLNGVFSATPCSSLNLAQSYDVIVVGSGPGGAVAARRLAERNPNWSILQIERGPRFEDCVSCASGDPAAAGPAQADPLTGINFVTPPQPGLANRNVTIKDASIQGGASSIAGGENVRGDLDYYYDNFWPVSWNWDIMSQFEAKYEDYHFPAGFYGNGPFPYNYNFRGNHGPVDITQDLEKQIFFDKVKEVFPHISPNCANCSSNNGYHPGRGATSIERLSYNGLRSSAYTSYVRPYTASNLVKIVRTRVNKVIFSGTKATGVQIVTVDPTTQKAISQTCIVSATDIILSAGAIGTPKLLKLSGVGPAAELQSKGIAVVSNLPDVGANLDDHLTMLAVLSGNGVGNEGLVLWNGQDDPSIEPNFQLESLFPAGGGIYYALVVPHYLNARGSVKLASSNPDVAPIVDPNYFGNQQDKVIFAPAFNKSLLLYKKLGYTNVADPCVMNRQCNTQLGQLEAYISAGLFFPGYHFSGTAAICKVVSSLDLSVKGTSNLYILDASIFPRTGGGNTQSVTYAVAERGIDQIELSIKLPGTFGELFPNVCI